MSTTEESTAVSEDCKSHTFCFSIFRRRNKTDRNPKDTSPPPGQSLPRLRPHHRRILLRPSKILPRHPHRPSKTLRLRPLGSRYLLLAPPTNHHPRFPHHRPPKSILLLLRHCCCVDSAWLPGLHQTSCFLEIFGFGGVGCV